MEKEVLEFIKQKKLINPGETIGVAVSGGIDSMSLLHFLNKHKEDLECEVVAITIDHLLRGESSYLDAEFVKTWCKQNHIVCSKFSVDAGKLSKEKNMTIEEAAREGRYNIFNKLIQENHVDKIALAHHVSDQVETILLHLFRGAGLNGVVGMKEDRNGMFIRPFLNTTKEDIVKYAAQNYIEYVEDETNSNNKFNRNYLRNVVIPNLKQKWEGLEQNILNFANSCREDNDYILSHVKTDGIIAEENIVKIPILYFYYDNSVINRIIFSALKKLNAVKDIERKHIDLIKNMLTLENGKKISLPNNLFVQKEYDYITIYKVEKKVITQEYPFKVGKFIFGNMYEIIVKRSNKPRLKENTLVVDASLIPETALWRTRKPGDTFTKFGGGTKSLKNYLVDKKIPNRIRDIIPVLANNKQILCVSNYEISDNVKITDQTKWVYFITVKEISNKK